MEAINLSIFAGGLSWPVYAAQAEGLFTRRGLEVCVEETPDSVAQLTGLMAGDHHIAMTPFDNVVACQEGQGEAAFDETPDLFAFMGGVEGSLRLMVSPDVGSFADIKGRKVGVDSERTGYTLAMYDLLARNGVSSADCVLCKTGGTTYRVKALRAGKIAGTMVSAPQDIAPARAGFRRLGDVSTTIGPYQAVCGVARRSWAAQASRELCAFIAAYAEASDWLVDPANRERAQAIYVSRIPDVGAELAALAWDAMSSEAEGFQRGAKFNATGAETVLRIRSEHGRPRKALTDWTRYVDESFYHGALSAGQSSASAKESSAAKPV